MQARGDFPEFLERKDRVERNRHRACEPLGLNENFRPRGSRVDEIERRIGGPEFMDALAAAALQTQRPLRRQD
jgi:hypothetical protein